MRSVIVAGLTVAVAASATPVLAAPPPASPSSAATTNAPIVWPLTITSGDGTIVLSEPQVRTWPGYTRMTGIAAVAVTLPGANAPVYGTLSFSSLASADVPAGVVSLVNPTIDATMWPSATPADVPALDAFLKANLHIEHRPLLPLALAIASLPKGERPHTVPLRTNPPVIYMSQSPAVLVGFDGKPQFAPIAGTSLSYAVNTNWDIIRDPATALYYVHARSGWYSTPGLTGPFTPTVAPASFSAIPASGRFAELHAALAAPKPHVTVVPRVIVSTVPAALIDIAGPPQFATIPGTQLRYVSNTTTDLFFSRATTLWYVLLAGRWFAAANLNGPWHFASTRLPADFKKIPEDGPRGRVLTSVPGTTQAFYAANAVQMPRVATADPATMSLTVSYDGAPVFEPIASTPLFYATNTQTDVIKVDDAHYLACNDGVWFAAGAPNGPWTPATYVPAVVYSIPESSPLYHVTFVHVYDARGVAMTAPRATPQPAPTATYQTFAPSQFSQGDRASYYNTATTGYFSGYASGWGGVAYGTGYGYPGYYGDEFFVPTLPTYGNYNDTSYARGRAANNQILGTGNAPIPGHGPRSVPGPGTNVFAAIDGVYRYVQGGWQKNAGGETWTPAATTPASLARDLRARADGYAGYVGAAR